MRSFVGTCLLLVIFVLPVRSNEPAGPPKTGTPALVVVRKVDREKQEVTFAVVALILEKAKGEPDKNKPPEPPMVRHNLQEFTTGLEGFRFVTAGGKELSDKEGWARLKVGSVVITSSDPRGVDPVFRAVLAPDALMIVPIGWKEPPKKQ